MRVLLLLGAAALVTPAIAIAEEAPKTEEPRKICRDMQPPTGSRRPGKRLCKTAEEWKAWDRGDVEYQQTSSGTPVRTQEDPSN